MMTRINPHHSTRYHHTSRTQSTGSFNINCLQKWKSIIVRKDVTCRREERFQRIEKTVQAYETVACLDKRQNDWRLL